MSRNHRENLAYAFASLFGRNTGENFQVDVRDPIDISQIDIPDPRVIPAKSIKDSISRSPQDRISHCRGKSFIDVVRSLHGDFTDVPDLVAYPKTEGQLVDVLDWCYSQDMVVVIYGGGSSVVGGVNCPPRESNKAVLVLDTSRLDEVEQVDRQSRTAEIQAGAYGPQIETQLKSHELTLRHYPQSFEFSTLGGWIATRSGGHYATNRTRIDDFTQSVRIVTPRGTFETSGFPSSGAGLSQNSLVLGSEGIFGVITKAVMRLQDVVRFKETLSVTFGEFSNAVEAARALAQSGLNPSNARLLDETESFQSAGVKDGKSLLIVGFESPVCPVATNMACAREIVETFGGVVQVPVKPSDSTPLPENLSGAESWKSNFMAAPYLRDAIITTGNVAETFETSITWDRFGEFHTQVLGDVRKFLDRECGGGVISCRFTHIYPDGPAPYYTVVAPSSHDDQISTWRAIKEMVSQIIVDKRATISHHHSVGKDHAKWYLDQTSEFVVDSTRLLKNHFDPKGLVNPGVLLG